MPIQVSNVKAADPGVAFTLEVPANEPPLNDTFRAVVTITDHSRTQRTGAPPTNVFTSEVWVKNPTKDRVMKCMAPFGDEAYAPEVVLSFQIDLYIPCEALLPTVCQKGAVIATYGHFHFGSDMIRKVENGKKYHLPATNGMPMMVSEDGTHIGVLYKDANFMIFPQSVFGDKTKIPPSYISNTAANTGDEPVHIIMENGFVFIATEKGKLFKSDQQASGDSWAVIQEDGFYLISEAYPPLGPISFKPLKKLK